MSVPTKITHGLMVTSYDVQLRGAPLPTPDTHDHIKAVDRVAVDLVEGAGTRPQGMPRHSNEALRVYVELDEIPDTQFRQYALIVEQASKGKTVSYSPLGSTSYDSSGWTLVSTTDGWVETRFGIWSGSFELRKKGSAL